MSNGTTTREPEKTARAGIAARCRLWLWLLPFAAIAMPLPAVADEYAYVCLSERWVEVVTKESRTVHFLRTVYAKEQKEAERELQEKLAEQRRIEEQERERAEAGRMETPAGPVIGRTFRDCPSCPEVVVVPAGSFTMGSPSHERGRDGEEGPIHRVTIAEPFAVGKYEVTFAEWDTCAAAGGCGGYRPDDRGWGRGDRPAINVSWNDAKAYVGWLSEKTGESYRLLSEAELEYAARADGDAQFLGGRGRSEPGELLRSRSPWRLLEPRTATPPLGLPQQERDRQTVREHGRVPHCPDARAVARVTLGPRSFYGKTEAIEADAANAVETGGCCCC
ncbi:MAG: formylglycine-generating enzyme family protein [Rhodospirillaceae bacterium]|nr:formylglycine-generating enzyme family protein [Rhodospirillaceae bacterium]